MLCFSNVLIKFVSDRSIGVDVNEGATIADRIPALVTDRLAERLRTRPTTPCFAKPYWGVPSILKYYVLPESDASQAPKSELTHSSS